MTDELAAAQADLEAAREAQLEAETRIAALQASAAPPAQPVLREIVRGVFGNRRR